MPEYIYHTAHIFTPDGTPVRSFLLTLGGDYFRVVGNHGGKTANTSEEQMQTLGMAVVSDGFWCVGDYRGINVNGWTSAAYARYAVKYAFTGEIVATVALQQPGGMVFASTSGGWRCADGGWLLRGSVVGGSDRLVRYDASGVVIWSKVCTVGDGNGGTWGVASDEWGDTFYLMPINYGSIGLPVWSTVFTTGDDAVSPITAWGGPQVASYLSRGGESFWGADAQSRWVKRIDPATLSEIAGVLPPRRYYYGSAVVGVGDERIILGAKTLYATGKWSRLYAYRVSEAGAEVATFGTNGLPGTAGAVAAAVQAGGTGEYVVVIDQRWTYTPPPRSPYRREVMQWHRGVAP